MNPRSKVFLLVLSGKHTDALAFARRRYPSTEIVRLSKAELRESGWKSQLRRLRQLEGEALLIFADSLGSLQEPMLLKWTALIHRCRETVLADSSGSFEATTRRGALSLLPRSLAAAFSDAIILAAVWIGLKMFQVWLKIAREPEKRDAPLDLAFVYPSQRGLDVPGGAQTHVTGFLSGLAQEGAHAAVFSGRSFQTHGDLHLHAIPGDGRFHLSREAAGLSYNIRFIAAGRKLLGQKPARLLYQRHGKFMFAGAVLSRLMKIPLVLEYNASEDWMAKHWDPSRFRSWLRLCEKVSLDAASLIVVVSRALEQQLMEVGVPAHRILVNQNAVDPEWFHPDCGGEKLRRELGFRSGDIVVCFVGTFSYWHGVTVLEQAIESLLKTQSTGAPLKFLLVGDGPFAPQIRSALELRVRQGSVIFAGSVPHSSVRVHLDAADILVSPHVPMPGGTPFFGSPTKLFEYMAMGKAIAASELDQISEVLEHGRTALLVKPGDPGELAQAIEALAVDARLRSDLGHNAMETALARHTWRQNARRVLTHDASRRHLPTAFPQPTAVPICPSSRAGQTPQSRISDYEC
jgi:glycosyltransferase involved in cell wall biosynthesis